MARKYNHYFKNVAHLECIDVYRVLELFGVTDPCLQHAVKKLLCAGIRGVKDQGKDIQEAIDALQRALEMRQEDDKAAVTLPLSEFNAGIHVVTYPNIDPKETTGCNLDVKA